MLTKAKGDLAVAQAITHYMSSGYEVCLPIGDKRPYDLIIELKGNIIRVQVKYAGYYTKIGKHKVALRTTGGNQSWHSAKKYSDHDFDELFAYTADGRKFVIPWRNVAARNELSIEHPKYAQYEVAKLCRDSEAVKHG